MEFRTLEDLELKNKTVLLRVDLNVPIVHGKIEDTTRIERLVPTINSLLEAGAKVVAMSHFGRPKGEFVLDMSLAPIADALSNALDGKPVNFAVDCIGESAEQAVKNTGYGEVILLENLRFHKGEASNDPEFVASLAKLGDCYVNDTFSCAHRSHASIVGLAEKLPSAAGLLLQEEIENLSKTLNNAGKPIAAIVGGSKVSTKLQVLKNLVKKVDLLIIGGAMANTFLFAKGYNIGKSLYEPELKDDALSIIKAAKEHNCELFLPEDVITAKKLEAKAPCEIKAADAATADDLILDIGPESIAHLHQKLKTFKTVIWNGPLGAFEVMPFGVGTYSLARTVAQLTQSGQMVSVGGGGDVVSALTSAGLTDKFTYISTAGGAFLEWLEGNKLPGITAIRTDLDGYDDDSEPKKCSGL